MILPVRVISGFARSTTEPVNKPNEAPAQTRDAELQAKTQKTSIGYFAAIKKWFTRSPRVRFNDVPQVRIIAEETSPSQQVVQAKTARVVSGWIKKWFATSHATLAKDLQKAFQEAQGLIDASGFAKKQPDPVLKKAAEKAASDFFKILNTVSIEEISTAKLASEFENLIKAFEKEIQGTPDYFPEGRNSNVHVSKVAKITPFILSAIKTGLPQFIAKYVAQQEANHDALRTHLIRYATEQNGWVDSAFTLRKTVDAILSPLLAEKEKVAAARAVKEDMILFKKTKASTDKALEIADKLQTKLGELDETYKAMERFLGEKLTAVTQYAKNDVQRKEAFDRENDAAIGKQAKAQVLKTALTKWTRASDAEIKQVRDMSAYATLRKRADQLQAEIKTLQKSGKELEGHVSNGDAQRKLGESLGAISQRLEYRANEVAPLASRAKSEMENFERSIETKKKERQKQLQLIDAGQVVAEASALTKQPRPVLVDAGEIVREAQQKYQKEAAAAG